MAPDYGTTGWLAFYLPKGHLRGAANAADPLGQHAEPDRALLAGKLLSVDEARPGAPPYLKDMFAADREGAEFARKRGPLTIESYALDLLEGANGEVLDRSPPPNWSSGRVRRHTAHLAGRSNLGTPQNNPPLCRIRRLPERLIFRTENPPKRGHAMASSNPKPLSSFHP